MPSIHSIAIYQIETSFQNDTIIVKTSTPHTAYFSNLTSVYNSIKDNLATKGWPTEGVNYTALYRKIKERGVVTITIKLVGSPILTIKVTRHQMNNPLETLGIDTSPLVDNK